MNFPDSSETPPQLTDILHCDPENFIGGTIEGIEEGPSCHPSDTHYIKYVIADIRVKHYYGWQIVIEYTDGQGNRDTIEGNVAYVSCCLQRDGSVVISIPYTGEYRLIAPIISPVSAGYDQTAARNQNHLLN